MPAINVQGTMNLGNILLESRMMKIEKGLKSLTKKPEEPYACTWRRSLQLTPECSLGFVALIEHDSSFRAEIPNLYIDAVARCNNSCNDVEIPVEQLSHCHRLCKMASGLILLSPFYQLHRIVIATFEMSRFLALPCTVPPDFSFIQTRPFPFYYSNNFRDIRPANLFREKLHYAEKLLTIVQKVCRKVQRGGERMEGRSVESLENFPPLRQQLFIARTLRSSQRRFA
ncbi:hypothetical protein Trydic_g8664 [Trypoxylus dichotomus]